MIIKAPNKTLHLAARRALWVKVADDFGRYVVIHEKNK